MQLVSITPKNLWGEMFKQPIAMCLTHLVMEYPEYAEMIKNRPDNCFVMLDNSIIELGESVTLQDILDAADKVHADEIILRDGYPYANLTQQRIKEDIEYLRKHNLTNKYKIMAVCHGQNEKEFKQTFEFINSIPEITCIGIPKVLSVWGGDRQNLFHIWKNTNKELHLLGSWYSLSEMLRLRPEVRERVRSCDTCLPSLLAIQNKHVWEDRKGTINLSQEYPELTPEKYYSVLKEYNQEYSNIYKYVEMEDMN